MEQLFCACLLAFSLALCVASENSLHAIEASKAERSEGK